MNVEFSTHLGPPAVLSLDTHCLHEWLSWDDQCPIALYFQRLFHFPTPFLRDWHAWRTQVDLTRKAAIFLIRVYLLKKIPLNRIYHLFCLFFFSLNGWVVHDLWDNDLGQLCEMRHPSPLLLGCLSFLLFCLFWALRRLLFLTNLITPLRFL